MSLPRDLKTAIRLDQLRFYGGDKPVSIQDYYRNGVYLTRESIPKAYITLVCEGQISLRDFYLLCAPLTQVTTSKTYSLYEEDSFTCGLVTISSGILDIPLTTYEESEAFFTSHPNIDSGILKNPVVTYIHPLEDDEGQIDDLLVVGLPTIEEGTIRSPIITYQVEDAEEFTLSTPAIDSGELVDKLITYTHPLEDEFTLSVISLDSGSLS